MKAAVLHKARDLRIEEIEKPELDSGEALVKVNAVGICGSDIHYYKYGRVGTRLVRKPHILGHEVSGIIEAVGKNDRGLKKGMAVGIDPSIPCGECELCVKGEYNFCKSVIFCGSPPNPGGMKEYMTHPVKYLFPIPDNISTEEGILLETISVGIHSIDSADINLGDSAAIFGAGNIGLTILQLAKLFGVFDVYMVDPLDYRLKIAEDLGATAVINPNHEDPVEKIIQLTNGRGVDAGFEAAGVPETPQQTINSIRQAGTFVFVGIIPTSIIQWDTEEIRKKGINIKMIHRSRHAYERAIQLVKKGKFNIKPYITHKFLLEKAVEAFKTVENYEDNILKAIIKP